MSRANDSAWVGIRTIDDAVGKRGSSNQRDNGITMVIDTGIGVVGTQDHVEIAGDYIDLWKFAFGTSAVTPRKVLARKLAILREANILTMPGGTLLEVALEGSNELDSIRLYLQRAKELGFPAVEISDGSVEMTPGVRRYAIETSHEFGLIPYTEVGSKDPRRQPSPERLVELALTDIDNGVEKVIIEGRESGKNVGIYDRDSNICELTLDIIADGLADHLEKLIWEVPQKSQQAALIQRFGCDVNLGNIDCRDAIALEALRRGMRYETLAAERRSSTPQVDERVARQRQAQALAILSMVSP
uniref:Phosphosulfolactate synthase n=1 Tax=Haliea sp. ETY-M TaxID=1055105 RepID=A0A455R338_9GAMM|nr:phosphosulfolactate synthase [Haliea sp. ETY-M]